MATKWVPGTAGASITSYRGGNSPPTRRPDERVRRADALQYELGSGPCVDARPRRLDLRPEDLLTDGRWPEYGTRVAQRAGLPRRCSRYRLHTGVEEVLSGLNLYADEPGAYDDAAVARGLLVATRAAASIAGRKMGHSRRRWRADRDIGARRGVLMSAHKVTREQAFDLLSVASQRRNRRLRTSPPRSSTGWLTPRSESARTETRPGGA